ncbi:BQ5605_C004g03049 [Microbotryum silenes-dioicae]|uniref:BQ5605_C004g03049 protein n=1 Tax=Microbotryum silenes-dioicae TaxID=796604 RepID=A0A2X0MCX2_9BASI|nr:BQ5605_C004g03049 [Microbotryum silenes-dioicae]
MACAYRRAERGNQDVDKQNLGCLNNTCTAYQNKLADCRNLELMRWSRS